MNDHQALVRIGELIAPHVSTRFVTGDVLADDIEAILAAVGIRLHDTEPGVGVQAVEHRPWWVRNGEFRG